MKRSFRNLFGLRRKAKPDAGMPQSLVSPDHWESQEQFEAYKARLREMATENPEYFRALMRAAAMETPKGWMAVNFPGAQVMESGPQKGLPSVPEDDIRCFYAMDMRKPHPHQIVAVMMVVMPPEGPDGPRVPIAGEGLDSTAMKEAEVGLAEQLRFMYEKGIVHTVMAVISIGVDLNVFKFSPEKGLEDLEVENKVEKMPPPTDEEMRQRSEATTAWCREANNEQGTDKMH